MIRQKHTFIKKDVALFTRAWIEMLEIENVKRVKAVALFTRAWIEMIAVNIMCCVIQVALFTRAWIEIIMYRRLRCGPMSPSSRGRGLK